LQLAQANPLLQVVSEAGPEHFHLHFGQTAQRNCMVKPPLRTKSIGTKVSDDEYAALENLAQARGLTLGESPARIPHL
jgi:hypothetical protein